MFPVDVLDTEDIPLFPLLPDAAMVPEERLTPAPPVDVLLIPVTEDVPPLRLTLLDATPIPSDLR